jgi:hypothetical protein
MVISFPEDTEDTIDAIRDAIGREVNFVTATLSGCVASGCYLDPVTDTSTNSFCPTCSGVYWIPTYTDNLVTAHVTWAGADILSWVAGGQYFDGDCRVQIKYTDTNLTLADSAEYVEIDNKILTIKSKILRGVQNLNRIILDLIEKE